jgi:hypothetical protein
MLLNCFCLLQCLLLVSLASFPSLLHISSGPSPIDLYSSSTISKIPTAVRGRNITQHIQSSHLALASIPNELLEGVAVTLFLEAPRWFQARYTLMVQNILVNLPRGWKVQIFYTGKGPSSGLELSLGLQRLIANGLVELTLIPYAVSKLKSKKKEIMTDTWIWENMIADKVLIFGGNSAICGNSPYSFHEFSKFDWIGAPWDSFQGRAGDGEISFRNRKLMIRAIEWELAKYTDSKELANAQKVWGYEDQFFVKRLLELEKSGERISIASRNETLRFAANDAHAPLGVFAASMTLAGATYDMREKFLRYCLELKMIFPSLHDPHCFGAQPTPDLCKKSICALQEPLKGGCR